MDNKFKPRLTRRHRAFKKMTESVQLDLHEDSGDDLEDYWESTSTYLSDDLPHTEL